MKLTLGSEDINKLMGNAVQLHQTGDLLAAEIAYRDILKLHSSFSPASHFLGVVLSQLKRHDEAVNILNQAIIELPNDAVVQHNLALALFHNSEADSAINHYQIALKLKPNFSDAHFNLGNALKDKKRYEDAVSCYRQALLLKPKFPTALNNLANTLMTLGRLDEALDQVDQALVIKPDYAECYLNRGNILTEQKRFDEAISAYGAALKLNPVLIEAQLNLAKTHSQSGQHDKAIELIHKVIAQEPDNHDAHNSLGCCWMDLNKLQSAMKSLARCIECKSDSAEGHFNYALALLKSGCFAQGWKEYEWRIKGEMGKSHYSYQKPRWLGESFANQTLMIYVEQGFGDSIQFIRFIPQVKKLGGHVILLCQPELIRLFTGVEGIDTMVSRPLEGVPDIEFDCLIPLMSLPHVLAINSSDQFCAEAYLTIENPPAAKWHQQISDDGKLNVGIVWAGNPKHKNDLNRSIPFDLFGDLAKISGVKLYSLKVGPDFDQIKISPNEIKNLGSQITDFQDTAEAVSCLDLVITVDTSIAHLAGAMGKPVWVLLPFAPDWRWMLESDGSPWYQSMRLFRQQQLGEWSYPFQRISEALEVLSTKKQCNDELKFNA